MEESSVFPSYFRRYLLDGYDDNSNTAILRIISRAPFLSKMLVSWPSEHLTKGTSHAGKVRTLSTHFRTDPYRETGAPRRASRQQGRALRQTRGLQFGARFRRQQAAQARIHHSRRHP